MDSSAVAASTQGAGILGESEDGLRCMAAVRDRCDGHRRNPFDEAECGHHYVRAMASWAAVLACSGFQYSARTKTLQFRAGPSRRRHFWSTGSAWGICEADETRAVLRVGHGTIDVQTLRLVDDRGKRMEDFTLPEPRTLYPGCVQVFQSRV